jgi:hypothetical protein
MSSNYQGRGRGGRYNSNGPGRGRGRGRGNQAGEANKTAKEGDMKFTPYGTWGGKVTVTFDTVKDHILQVIQKTYKHAEDVVTSLRAMEKVDLSSRAPVLLKSENTDEETKKIEQKGLELRYQTDYTRYCERLDTLDQNMIKAYALIFSTYCSKIMQSRIEQHADFESDIRDNPIRLLETIQVLMHDTIRGRYPYASVTDAMKNLLYIKQQDNEPLLDYAK